MRKYVFFTIVLLLIMYQSDTLYSQYKERVEVPDVSIRSDSLFKKFVRPEIPEYMYVLNGSTREHYCDVLTVVVHVRVCKDLKVCRIIVNNLYGIDNHVPKDHKVWSDLEKNIIKASEGWIFKPIEYDVREDDPEDFKEYCKTHRPYSGKQEHLILMRFSLNCHTRDPNFLYLLVL